MFSSPNFSEKRHAESNLYKIPSEDDLGLDYWTEF